MKRFLSLALLFAILLSFAAVPTEAAESDLRFRLHSLDIVLTPNRTLKIGEAPSDPAITWSVDFTPSAKSTTLTYLPEMTRITLHGDPDNNHFLGTSNKMDVSLAFECYMANGVFFFPNEKFSFSLNGQSMTLDAHQLYLEQDFSAPPITAEDGMELYRYLLRLDQIFDIPLTLPDAPTYSFSVADNPLIYDYDLNSMPWYAQAGARVPFPPNYSVGGHMNEVTDILCNGKSVGINTYFITMPDSDVLIDFVVNGGGGPSGNTVVKDLTINLDFSEDIYYGRTLPTTADLKKALSFSTSVPGAGLYLEMADVDYLFDDTFGNTLQPWVGNTFLSFVIKAKDGFVFTDGAFAEMEELNQWQKGNVKITFNGKRNHYGTGQTHDYYKGYFVSDYLFSDRNGIELHIFWYGGVKANMDTSRFKAGDTVTIPDSCFNFDGYIPYCYDYIYTDPNGEPHRDRVMGKSFVHPETNGTPIEIYVMYVRGEKKSPATRMTKDAAEAVEVVTDHASFPAGTVVSVDLVQPQDEGGQTVINHAKDALKDHGTDCLVLDISASSFNQAVQPSGKVLVSFDIPKSFDKDHIDFCYISDDGTVERIPMEIDPVTGKCTAALEHFSLYAIVKTVEKTQHSAHTIHLDSDRDGACDSCGIAVEPVVPPVTDDPTTDNPGTDTPGTDDPDTTLPQTPSSPTEPATPDTTTPTEDGQIIAGVATGPADNELQTVPTNQNDGVLLWSILGVCAAAAIAAAVFLILRRKQK